MTVEQWLNENELSIDIWKNKYRYKNESLNEWFNRVSSNNPVIKRLRRSLYALTSCRSDNDFNFSAALSDSPV